MHSWLTTNLTGEVVYFGEAKDILAYFDELGYVCPPHVNPADYFRACFPTGCVTLHHPDHFTLVYTIRAVDLMTVDPRSEEAEKESRERLEDLCQAWSESDEAKAVQNQVSARKAKPSIDSADWHAC